MALIFKQIEVGPMANFAYIFACSETGHAVLVDPSAEPQKLLAMLDAEQLTLQAIINTHGHADHIAGNAAIKAQHDVPVYVHRDADLRPYRIVSAQIFRALQGQQAPEPEHRLDDNATIKVGKLSLQVIHAPGHSPGDILLYWPGDDDNEALVMTGDVLFVEAIGRTDLPGSAHLQMENSLRDKVATLPDATRVYPGHNYGPRPSSSIGVEKRRNPFLREALGQR